MRRFVWVLAVTLLYGFSVGVATQQQSAAEDMSWALPDRVQREIPADPAAEACAPIAHGPTPMSRLATCGNPADWYPDQHPTPPEVVVKGQGDAMACGSCHLMSGLGHPESSDLTGLTVPYIVQQMLDFKSGTRQDPTGKRMNSIATR